MIERPILFSDEMVCAILDGRKTQTRRVIKPQESLRFNPIVLNGYAGWENLHGNPRPCPYGKSGDRLWVRETFVVSPPCWAGEYSSDYNIRDDRDNGRIIYYLADNKPGVLENARQYKLSVKASIHMPRWASRILLEVISVRVGRVQDITEDDAEKEGMTYYGETLDEPTPKEKFAKLWNTINAKRGYGWDVNPWVWVIEFKVVTK
jgi:hypothetical protein